MIGFTEVLTFILCSKKENFSMLNRKDDKSKAVIIGNPRSSDFEVHTLSCIGLYFCCCMGYAPTCIGLNEVHILNWIKHLYFTCSLLSSSKFTWK